MFIIAGTKECQKKLEFEQRGKCPVCGRDDTYIEVYLVYMCFFLYFIPTFKWRKRYYATMTCCGSFVQLDKEIGKDIEKNMITYIEVEKLELVGKCDKKTCNHCGEIIEDRFDFCPKCGSKI